MVNGTGSAGLVDRLRVAAAGDGFGPHEVAAILGSWLSAGSEPLEPELLHRAPGQPWVLTPLHRAADSSWSVLVAVFAPGERAPVHDHGAWAVIGIVAGRERETRFRRGDAGLEMDRTSINPAGVVTIVPAGAIHTVEALDGQDAVSVHVYGTDIVTQPRHTYDPDTASAGPFRPPFAEPARP
jgi:3-mercaptopropionate dioxygenase